MGVFFRSERSAAIPFGQDKTGYPANVFMVEFTVYGPFTVPTVADRRGRGGRKRKKVTTSCGREFWRDIDDNHAHLAAHKGCYVFVLRAGRGAHPWYIGKTEKSKRTLKQEVFSPDKLTKYNKQILKGRRRGLAQLYFLVRSPGNRGRIGRAIDELETLLIWVARNRNRGLTNKKKIDTQPARLVRVVNNLAVHGLLNSRQGKPSKAARAFNLVVAFRERKPYALRRPQR